MKEPSYSSLVCGRIEVQGRDSASHLLILQAGVHLENSYPLCGRMLFLTLQEPLWPLSSLCRSRDIHISIKMFQTAQQYQVGLAPAERKEALRGRQQWWKGSGKAGVARHLWGVRGRAEQMHGGHVFLAKGPYPVPEVAVVAGRSERGHQYMLLMVLHVYLHVKQDNAFAF